MYFQIKTENEPRIQFLSITNDDVLVNNIRHKLEACVTFTTGKNGTSVVFNQFSMQQFAGYLRQSVAQASDRTVYACPFDSS